MEKWKWKTLCIRQIKRGFRADVGELSSQRGHEGKSKKGILKEPLGLGVTLAEMPGKLSRSPLP